MRPGRREIGARTRAESIAATAGLLVTGLGLFFLWTGQPGLAQGQQHEPLQLQSGSFQNGGAIPRQFTCDGADNSPALHWANVPAGARSFALVVHDPDAPVDFTHWLAYNLPANVLGLAESASGRGVMPEGSAEGTNSFDRIGYGGPCPPPGKPHRYLFRLYALDAQLNLPPGMTRDQLESAIRPHILAEAQIVGLYRRAVQ